MTAPRSFQFYEGEGPLYALTITARGSRNKRTFLHTFAFRERAEVDGFAYGDHDATWVVATPLTSGQADQAEARRGRTRAPAIAERRDGAGEQGDELIAESFVAFGSESMKQVPVRLAQGVDVQPAVLSVILNALHSHGRHEVDIGDIKVVVSQLGSVISKFIALPDEMARNAEATLYSEILQRCSML